jgi:small-conductance mechanosensitive channel
MMNDAGLKNKETHAFTRYAFISAMAGLALILFVGLADNALLAGQMKGLLYILAFGFIALTDSFLVVVMLKIHRDEGVIDAGLCGMIVGTGAALVGVVMFFSCLSIMPHGDVVATAGASRIQTVCYMIFGVTTLFGLVNCWDALKRANKNSLKKNQDE